MTSGQNPSAGRTRSLLLVALVGVLAVVAAVLTVVVSDRTYSPNERALSPKTQVAAGSDHHDVEAGLTVRVPEGWRVQEGDLVFGSTALVPDGETAGDGGEGRESREGAEGPGGIVLVGELTPEMFASRESDNQRAAAVLVSGMGEFFLPIPGRRTEPRMQEISTRVGDGWALSYRVVPEGAVASGGGVTGGGLVYTAVVGGNGTGDETGEEADGGAGTGKRYWLTYIGAPADGSMDSPHAEWADEIVERLRQTEGGGDVASVERAPGQTA